MFPEKKSVFVECPPSLARDRWDLKNSSGNINDKTQLGRVTSFGGKNIKYHIS
jgi:hypothetical protein